MLISEAHIIFMLILKYNVVNHGGLFMSDLIQNMHIYQGSPSMLIHKYVYLSQRPIYIINFKICLFNVKARLY